MDPKPSWQIWMEGIVLVIMLSIIISFVLYWSCLRRLLYWRRRGIPHVAAWPILGSIRGAALNHKPMGEVYADIYFREKGKRYVGFHQFTQPCILLRDPDLVKKVIVTDFDYFPSYEIKGYRNLDPMLSRHLYSLSGLQWRRLRRSLSQAFTRDKLCEVFPLFQEVCEILRIHVSLQIEGFRGRWAVELRELCTNFTTSVMSSCALGIPCDAINHPDTELRKVMTALLEPTTKTAINQFVFFQIPWLAKLLRIPFVPHEVTEFFRRTVSGEVGRREQHRVERNDYMQMFMRLWYEGSLSLGEAGDQEGYSDSTGGNKGIFGRNFHAINFNGQIHDMDDITAVAMTFVFDGTVPTANLLSFTLFELAHNPEVQNKLRKEVVEVLNRHEGIITIHALQSMPYLDMVLLEVLRLYPTFPFMVRTCAKLYNLPNPADGNSQERGLMVEKGTPVVVPVYGIHRDPLYYSNPEQFDPSRFSIEAMKGRKHFTYYPYGEGPRTCIGVRFGGLLAKAALAYLLPLINFIPNEKTSHLITLDPLYSTTVSKGGLWIEMQKI